jgi:hypothetical protein
MLNWCVYRGGKLTEDPENTASRDDCSGGSDSRLAIRAGFGLRHRHGRALLKRLVYVDGDQILDTYYCRSSGVCCGNLGGYRDWRVCGYCSGTALTWGSAATFVLTDSSCACLAATSRIVAVHGVVAKLLRTRSFRCIITREYGQRA